MKIFREIKTTGNEFVTFFSLNLVSWSFPYLSKRSAEKRCFFSPSERRVGCRRNWWVIYRWQEWSAGFGVGPWVPGRRGRDRSVDHRHAASSRKSIGPATRFAAATSSRCDCWAASVSSRLRTAPEGVDRIGLGEPSGTNTIVHWLHFFHSSINIPFKNHA